MSIINKYDYITGEILASYDSIKDASIANSISYHTIYDELKRDRLEYPRRSYYFGYTPKPRWVICCYDNELWDLLGTYRNIKIASYKTGVDFRLIQWQIDKDLDFKDRRCGCTGLFFRRELIDN